MAVAALGCLIRGAIFFSRAPNLFSMGRLYGTATGSWLIKSKLEVLLSVARFSEIKSTFV